MPLIGELCAIITALLWSGSSLTFSKAAKRMGTMTLNITRLFIAAILILVTVVIFGISFPKNLTQVIFLCISGIIGLFFGDTFLFKSYQYNSARISMLIMSISPALTAIVAFFILHQALSVISILGMMITLFGIALVILEGKNNGEYKSVKINRGILYAFLGAVGQAGALIFARLAFNISEINGFVATFIRIISALVFLIPVTILLKRFTNPLWVYKNDRKALMYTLLGAILGPYLGITFSLISIMFAKVAIASTLMSITPIPMLFLSKIFEHEVITFRGIIGTFIAVLGVAVLLLL